MIPPLSDDYVNYFMKLCVALAHDAIPLQEVPVSCIYVHYPSSSIVGSSFNQTVIKHNALRHCEVECLSQLEHQVREAITLSIGSLARSTINPDIDAHNDQTKPLSQPSTPLLTTTLNSSTPSQLFFPYIHQQQLNTIQLHGILQQPLSLQHRAAFNQLMLAVCADVVVFVSVEPCIMCTGVLHNAGISQVYAGCGNDKFGGCGSVASCHFGYDITNPLSRTHITSTLPPSTSIFNTASLLSQPMQQFPTNNQPPDHLIQLYQDLSKIPATPQHPWNFTTPTIDNINSSAPQTGLPLSAQIDYHQGYLRDQCINALQLFYFRGNPNAPADKRQRPLVQAQLDRLATMEQSPIPNK